MYYSKTASGFYHPEIHGDHMPADAVQITDTQYAALLDGQSRGEIIGADENGHPILTAPEPPTIAQARETATLSKIDFCHALYRTKILPADLVVDAALGKWPAPFEAALSGLPEPARVDAKLAWAGATSVSRTAPLFLQLLAFFAAQQGLTAEQAEQFGDQIFEQAI